MKNYLLVVLISSLSNSLMLANLPEHPLSPQDKLEILLSDAIKSGSQESVVNLIKAIQVTSCYHWGRTIENLETTLKECIEELENFITDGQENKYTIDYTQSINKLKELQLKIPSLVATVNEKTGCAKLEKEKIGFFAAFKQWTGVIHTPTDK